MAEPEEVEDVPDFNPVDFVAAARRRTMSTAVTSLEDDPEKASRTLELAEATGENPAIVFNNLENFEQQHKTRLASSLLNSNEYLRRYIEDEPLAAKVSNDDYGQLDAVAEKAKGFGVDSVLSAAVKATKYYGAVTSETLKGAEEGFGYASLAKGHDELALTLAANPVFANLFIRQGVVAAADTFLGTMHAFNALITGAAAGIGEAYKQSGIQEFLPTEEARSRMRPETLARDLIVYAQVGLSGQAGLHGIVPPEVSAAITQASQVAKAVQPYVAAGKEPPIGLHPIIDEIKVKQAKIDADNLGEALKEAVKSSTRERNPDLFASYVRKITDGEIGISADAVRKLYGEKPPTPGEGPLGFVDDLADQLRRAEATGGDIKVTVADWLAKVEPEVAKELGDHVRARPEGVTVEEGKNLPSMTNEEIKTKRTEIEDRRAELSQQAVVADKAGNIELRNKLMDESERLRGEWLDLPDPVVETVRQSAGLQGVQGRKLTLERGQDVGEAHVFVMRDATGKDIGELYIAEEAGGKRLFIDDIRSPEGPQSLGPKAMRDALEQLKEQFPNAETLEGMRVSGAREKANKPNVKTAIDLTKIKPRKKPEQLELDVTRIEDKEAFAKASAIGMTVDQYKRYQKLIDKQHAEDVAYYTKRTEAAAKKKISAEWKEAELELRPEVARQINAQPDVAADNYLRTGYLYGDNVGGLKLNEGLLTPEQKAVLPKEYYSKTGIHPDDLASLVGYPSGQVMINSLADFVAKRKASGMNPDNYRRRLIASEIERQVNERLGKRAEEILEEAKEQVLSETQQQLLHEQTLRLAEESGAEFSITKEDLIAGIQSVFERSRALDKAIASDTFLADAGRAGKAMEMALLKGDAAEAFRQSQRQYNAFTFAREAIKLEAERAKFEKSLKKLVSPTNDRINQADLNYIHELLNQAGISLRVTPDEIAKSIAFEGHGTLSDYVNWRLSEGWKPAISNSILSGEIGSLRKGSNNPMTVAQFREFMDAVDTIAFIGREQKKIDVGGEARDWGAFQQDVIDHVSSLPMRPREGQMNPIWLLDAELTRMEEIIKDLDLRKELGPLYRTVIEPMVAAKATYYDLLSDLSAHFQKHKKQFGMKWRKTLNDTIPQDFIWDPYTLTIADLSRENLIQIMLHWGNKSNRLKFSQGYATLELRMSGAKRYATVEEAAAFEAKTKALIDAHATKDDWDFVRMMWEPHKKLQPKMDTVSRNVSGKTPKWIEADIVPTRFGDIEGGYWPVKYDQLSFDLERVSGRPHDVNSTFGPDYFYPKLNAGSLKARTGYIDYPDINNSIQQAVGVMQQSAQYVAFHEALTQASRVLHDKKIRGIVTKHYGKEYTDQFIPWLQRIANKNISDPATPFYNRTFRWLRQNLVGYALPLNIPVAMAVDMGKVRSGAWGSYVANKRQWTELALEKSNEIRHLTYNLDRDFRTQLENLWPSSGIGGRYKGLRSEIGIQFERLQRNAVKFGLWPMMKMTQHFRTATFVSEYYEGLKRGLTDHEAAVVADAHVRERHGAASEVDLPSIMQSSEAMKNFTVFMTFLNSMRNGSRQIPGNIRRGEWGAATDNLVAYIVLPGLIGSLFFNEAKKDDSWPMIVAKGIGMMPFIGIPIVGQITQYTLGQSNPRDIYMTAVQGVKAAWAEAQRAAEGKSTKKPIKAIAGAVGPLTGLPTLGPGRTGQFLADVGNNRQQPRNFFDWYRGITYGDIKGRWKQ